MMTCGAFLVVLGTTGAFVQQFPGGGVHLATMGGTWWAADLAGVDAILKQWGNNKLSDVAGKWIKVQGKEFHVAWEKDDTYGVVQYVKYGPCEPYQGQ